MDRLSIIMTLPIGATIVGVLVIALLSTGMFGWTSLAMSVIAGMIVTWPVSYLISRRIKRKGTNHALPDRNERRKEPLHEV